MYAVIKHSVNIILIGILPLQVLLFQVCIQRNAYTPHLSLCVLTVKSMQWRHMSVMTTKTTGNSTLYSATYSEQQQSKHESFASTALCERNPPAIGGFPPQGASDVGSVCGSIAYWQASNVLLWGSYGGRSASHSRNRSSSSPCSSKKHWKLADISGEQGERR